MKQFFCVVYISLCLLSLAEAKSFWNKCSDAEGFFKTDDGVIVSPAAEPGETIVFEKLLKSIPLKTIKGTCESKIDSGVFTYQFEEYTFEVYQLNVDGWVRPLEMLCARGYSDFPLLDGLASVCKEGTENWSEVYH